MTLRTVTGLTTGILLTLLAAGCKNSDATGTPVPGQKADGTAAPKKEAAAPLGKPEVTMDATAWHAEFKKDPNAAKQKYKDKVIELTGTIDDVEDDSKGKVGYVCLKVMGDHLRVRVATKDKKPWLTVAPGSQVRVKGKVPESGRPGELFEGEVVDPGAVKPTFLTAEQIAKEYAADRKATVEKYQNKRMNVEGSIIEKGKSQNCEVQVKLKGQGDIVVSCCFAGVANEIKLLLDAAEPGQKLKVFGFLEFDDSNKKIILLSACALTEVQ
jgi:hypothetical protein